MIIKFTWAHPPEYHYYKFQQEMQEQYPDFARYMDAVNVDPDFHYPIPGGEAYELELTPNFRFEQQVSEKVLIGRLESRVKQLEKEIVMLNQRFDALWYAPGMPGANQIEAEINEDLMKKQKLASDEEECDMLDK